MRSTRLLAAVVVFLASAGPCLAATPKEINDAIQNGAAYLKKQYEGGKPEPRKPGKGREGVGPAALAGLALLEAGTPIDHPALKNITNSIRDASFSETGTYQIALSIMYLDRLGDPADVPLIQMLSVRLLAGQGESGGWSYQCPKGSDADERTLRTALMVTELKTAPKNPGSKEPPANPPKAAAKNPPVAKLHAEVQKYAAKLASEQGNFRGGRGDGDNSNTQFGIMGTWIAKRHGVNADTAIERIEQRFLKTQTDSGGWPYAGRSEGSPSMTCAGLLGLATGVGLREERRMQAQAPRPAPKTNPVAPVAVKPPEKSDDPFFNPVPVPKSDDPFFNPPKEEPKPKEPPKAKEPLKIVPKAPADPREAAIQKGLANLGGVLSGEAPGQGKGKNKVLAGLGLGNRDYYFLWSLERVGVVYGLELIGGVDWYARGADDLVKAQREDGWGDVVDTSFAVLFLCKSNFVRDLSARVQKDTGTELRATRAVDPAPMPKGPNTTDPPVVSPMPNPTFTPTPTPMPLPVPVPTPTSADPKVLANGLVGAADADWDAALVKVRDGKGTHFTQALVMALGQLDGDRRKAARDALAERLTRMTADTLRQMAKAEEAELRRATVLAMAMKDDRAHWPDLVAALADKEELVVKAARAGLKSVTGEDFGPAPDATPAERTAAIRAWADWLRKQK